MAKNKKNMSKELFICMLVMAIFLLPSCAKVAGTDIAFGRNVTWEITPDGVMDLLGSSAVQQNEIIEGIGEFTYVLAQEATAYNQPITGLGFYFFNGQLYQVTIQYDASKDVNALIENIADIFGEPAMASENEVGDALGITHRVCSWTIDDATFISVNEKREGELTIVSVQNRATINELTEAVNRD